MSNTKLYVIRFLLFHILFLSFAHFLTVQAQENQKPIELEKIVVTPGRFMIYDGATPQLSLSKKEIERFPLIDNDIMRSGHILPGVTANDYSARFSVRGGEKDGVSVRLDGMELYNPYHLQDFGGAVSLVGLGLIQRADLLMGGFPAEYGQKMSGVFDMTTKPPNTEKVSANFGIDLINATAMVEGPLTEKGGWMLSARRGYVDLILALIDLDEEYKPQYADVYGKLMYQITEADTLTLNGLYGWDKNLIRVDDIDNNLDSLYDNSTVWLKWRHTFGTSYWTDVFVFGGASSQERTTGKSQERTIGKSDFDNRDFRFLGTKAELTVNAFEKHTFRTGVEWRWSTAQYDYDVQERQAGINEYKLIRANIDDSGSDIKLFLQDEWQIHPKFALNVGGRYVVQNYRNSDVQNYEIGPRVAFAVSPKKNLVFRGAWGVYHQPVDLMSVPVEDNIKTVGRAEQAMHYILGCEYTRGNNFLIRLEGYYKKFDNLVGRLREFGRQMQIFTPPESADARGFDLFATQAVSSRLTWGLGYAYGIAKETSDNRTIFRQYDRRHSLFLSSSHQISSTWHLYLSWRFHTGDPRTPLTHEKVQLTEGSIACNRQFGETHSERLPAYHSLDFRITKRSPYKRWALTWYFQILNLYNHTNLDQYAFSEVRDEVTGAITDCVIEEEPQLPIIPTLGMTITF
ncbi:MAG: TonB-dependent receptor [Candidatus Poribacteria bacterium]|nr:TonB-dependent receptor [Candidatus Poribacteria bacterium]